MSAIAAHYPMFWLMFAHHQNTRGAPMAFANKPYMVEILASLPNLEEAVISKCVQTGFSEALLAYSIWRAGWSSRRIAYTLPQFQARKRFVQGRFDPLVEQVPGYRLRAGSPDKRSKAAGHAAKTVDNMSVKNFGRGVIFFLSSATDADFVELSVDTLIVDEYDLCDPTNIAKAEDRLAASPYPQRFLVGNPGLPNFGIDAAFNNTDRRRWHFRCGCCGERQPVDWEVNMVRKENTGLWVPRDVERAVGLAGYQRSPRRSMDIRPVCRRCNKPFDRKAQGGQWVAENPSRFVRGYTTTRLDDINTDAWRMFIKWLDAQSDIRKLATFYNSDLGKAAEASGISVTVEDLQAALDGHYLDRHAGPHYKDLDVVAGVDVGSVLHVEIDVLERRTAANANDADEGPPARRCVFAGTIPNFDALKDLMRRYSVDVCVVDAQPELHAAQNFRDDMNSETDTTVWLCKFHNAELPRRQSYGFHRDFRAHVVQVDRTQLLDATLDDIRNGGQTFPVDIISGVPHWIDEMRAPVRVVDEEKQRITWTAGAKADHFRFANAYARVAQDIMGAGVKIYD